MAFSFDSACWRTSTLPFSLTFIAICADFVTVAYFQIPGRLAEFLGPFELAAIRTTLFIACVASANLRLCSPLLFVIECSVFEFFAITTLVCVHALDTFAVFFASGPITGLEKIFRLGFVANNTRTFQNCFVVVAFCANSSLPICLHGFDKVTF